MTPLPYACCLRPPGASPCLDAGGASLKSFAELLDRLSPALQPEARLTASSRQLLTTSTEGELGRAHWADRRALAPRGSSSCGRPS